MSVSYSKLFVGISLPALCTGLAGLILCSSAHAQTIRPSTQKELKVFDPNASATGNVGIRAAAGTVSYTLTLPAAAPSVNQVLSANAVSGGTVSLTWATPFSGTGTTNYLSKFASAGTLTNSLLFDNGTNVGIGTTSPEAKLNIVNTVSANTPQYGGISELDFTRLSSNLNESFGFGATIKFKGSSGNDSPDNKGLSALSVNAFNSNTGTVDYMQGMYGDIRNLSTGTVTNFSGIRLPDGINSGGGTITNFYGLRIEPQTVGTNRQAISLNNAAATNVYNVYAGGTAQNYFAGNVGIGTTSPNSRLDINGGTTIGVGLQLDDAGFSPGAGELTIGEARGNGRDGIKTRLTLINGAYSMVENGSSIDFVTSTNSNASAIKSRISGFGDAGNTKGFLSFSTFNSTAIQEHMRIDNLGNVGIGTTSPMFRLVVEGNNETGAPHNGNKLATLGLIATNNTTGAGGSIEFGLRSNTTFAAIKGLGQNTSTNTIGDLAFYTRASVNDASMTERMRIKSDGKVSVNDTDPVGRFEVKANSADNEVLEVEDNNEVSLFRVSRNGDIRAGMLTGSGSRQLYVTFDGVLTTTSSDARLKTNIEVIPNALQKVMGLRGVTYNWKDGRDTTRVLGMIAQEMLKVAPELVFQNNNGYYGIHYAETTGLLVEAIKEQQKVIEQLKAEQTTTSSLLRQLQLDLQTIRKHNAVHKD